MLQTIVLKAAAFVVASIMGTHALAYIPGCNFDGNVDAYNACIQMQDAMRQQQWHLEEIQNQLQLDSYDYDY